MKFNRLKQKLALISALTLAVGTVPVHADAYTTLGIDEVTVSLNSDGSVVKAVTRNKAGIWVDYIERSTLDKTSKVIQSGRSYTVPVFIRLNDDHDALTYTEFGMDIDPAASFEIINSSSKSASNGGEILDWYMTYATNQSENMAWFAHSFFESVAEGTTLALVMVTIDNPVPNIQYPISYRGYGAGQSTSTARWLNNGADIYVDTYDGFVEFIQETEITTTTPETTTTTTSTTTTTTTTSTSTTTTTTTTTSTSTTTTTTTTTPETTTTTTAPSAPKSRAFIEGGDNWSFSNSRSVFGNKYSMKDNYYQKLLSGLENTEKEIIYDAVRNKSWSGSCYGMAVTSLLASNDILNPSDYESNAPFLYNIPAPAEEESNDVKSLINYYYMLQKTNLISSLTCQSQYESEADKLQKLLDCLEDDSPTLLTFYGNFYGSSQNYGGHAVVAYDVDYGSVDSYNQKAYNGKVKIYDSNAKGISDEYCLYFNTYDWSWYIPYYQIGSDNDAKFGLITDDIDILNHHGYLDQTASDDTLPDIDFIAELNAGSVNEDYVLHKGGYSNGVWMNASSSENDIRMFASMGDQLGESDLLFALKDTESGYLLRRKENAGKMDLSMHYENCLLNASASNGQEVGFTPDGRIVIDGEKTSYTMKLVLNDNSLVTDWYSVSVSGANTDSISLQKSDDQKGYILKGDALRNIRVDAYNDTDSALLIFSTDADSVLLYEIDPDTIGVKIDSNNDGIYDQLITQSPEPQAGDANFDGSVNILDVITVNRVVLGKDTFVDKQLQCADINQNGVADSTDSLAILKYLVGLISEL